MTEFQPYNFGKYRIEAQIGRGGFGTVYRAVDRRLDRAVALKIMDPLFTRDAAWVARFRREARLMARLDHPHIVPVYEADEQDGRLFLAMKLIHGPNLAHHLQQHGPLPWTQMLEVVTQIAAALDYAHDNDLIHRDLKPSNILLSAGQASLTDFGLARLAGEHSLSLTMSGGIVGTPAYLAPEVWEGKTATAAADVYALACIVYEMLTGAALFAGDTPPAVMLAHFQPPNWPESWPGGVPAGFAETLQMALAADPVERYASAGDFSAALQALAEDELAGPYARLQQAVTDENWDAAITLSAAIRDRKPDYRDVVALETRALAAQEAAQRSKWATQWREQAEQALAQGNLKGARAAAQKWREMAEDKTAVAAFLSRLEQRAAETAPESGPSLPPEPRQQEARTGTEQPSKSDEEILTAFTESIQNIAQGAPGPEPAGTVKSPLRQTGSPTSQASKRQARTTDTEYGAKGRRGASLRTLQRRLRLPARLDLRHAAIGAAAYALIAWITNPFVLRPFGSDGYYLALIPEVAVPLFFGLAFGPVVGLLSGLGGATLIQLAFLIQSGTNTPYLWVLVVGVGLTGLVAGLTASSITSYRDRNTILKAIIYSILGIIAKALFDVVARPFVAGQSYLGLSYYSDQFISQFRSGFRLAELFSAVILVPVLMIAYDAIRASMGIGTQMTENAPEGNTLRHSREKSFFRRWWRVGAIILAMAVIILPNIDSEPGLLETLIAASLLGTVAFDHAKARRNRRAALLALALLFWLWLVSAVSFFSLIAALGSTVAALIWSLADAIRDTID